MPFAAIPVLFGATATFTPAQRRLAVYAATVASFTILLLAQYTGEWIIMALGTSLPSLQIAGGMVIAVPLVAGPGAITGIMLEAHHGNGLEHNLVISLIIVGVVLAVGVILLLSEFFRRVLGRAGMVVFTRLFGLIVVAVAVEIFIKGVFTHLERAALT